MKRTLFLPFLALATISCKSKIYGQYNVGGINYVDRSQYNYWNNSVRDNLSKPIGIIGVGSPNAGYNRNTGSSGYDKPSAPRLTKKEKEQREAEKKAKAEIDKYVNDAAKNKEQLLTHNNKVTLFAPFIASREGHKYLMNAAGTISLPLDDVMSQKISTKGIQVPQWKINTSQDMEELIPATWLLSKGGRYAILHPLSDSTYILKPLDFTAVEFLAGPFEEKLFAVKDSAGKAAVLKTNEWSDTVITPFDFDAVNYFMLKNIADAEHIPVKTKGKWGVWDCNSNTFSVPCVYDSINFIYVDGYQHEGYCVKLSGKWGIYNRAQKKEVIPVQFDRMAVCFYYYEPPFSATPGQLNRWNDNMWNNIKRKIPFYAGANGDKRTYFDKNCAVVNPKKLKYSEGLNVFLQNGKRMPPGEWLRVK